MFFFFVLNVNNSNKKLWNARFSLILLLVNKNNDKYIKHLFLEFCFVLVLFIVVSRWHRIDCNKFFFLINYHVVEQGVESVAV